MIQRVSQGKASPYDKRQDSKGVPTKVTEELREMISDWLQIDAGRTQAELRQLCNKEVLRKHLVEGLQDHINLIMSDAEKQPNGPLDVTEKLKTAPPDVLFKFNRDCIKSDSTIGRALADNVLHG